MEQLGRIPEQGDQVPIPGGILRVDHVEGRRVDRIRFIPDSIGGRARIAASGFAESAGALMNDWIAIALLVILLIGNAFFCCG